MDSKKNKILSVVSLKFFMRKQKPQDKGIFKWAKNPPFA